MRRRRRRLRAGTRATPPGGGAGHHAPGAPRPALSPAGVRGSSAPTPTPPSWVVILSPAVGGPSQSSRRPWYQPRPAPGPWANPGVLDLPTCLLHALILREFRNRLKVTSPAKTWTGSEIQPAEWYPPQISFFPRFSCGLGSGTELR